MRHFLRNILYWIVPELKLFRQSEFCTYYMKSSLVNVELAHNVKVYSPYHLTDVTVGDYTYIALNSKISQTNIGKCCSIGPNLVCGWGIHPTDGVSTSPMFFLH